MLCFWIDVHNLCKFCMTAIPFCRMRSFTKNTIVLVEIKHPPIECFLSSNMNSLASQIFSRKGTCEMFRNIYRAMIISHTKSTATKVASSLSKHLLKDIGHSHSDIVRKAVETMSKELDQADLKKHKLLFFLEDPHVPSFPILLRTYHLARCLFFQVKPHLGQRVLRGQND